MHVKHSGVRKEVLCPMCLQTEGLGTWEAPGEHGAKGSLGPASQVLVEGIRGLPLLPTGHCCLSPTQTNPLP